MGDAAGVTLMTFDEHGLDEWFAAGQLVQRVYVEELGRVCDFGGAVNWLAHWREGDHGAEFESWLRRQFRESPEGQQRHGSPSAPTDPGPELPPAIPPPPPLPPLSVGPPRVLKITSAADGGFVNRPYSYWPNVWIIGGRARVFAGHVDGSPRLFEVDLATGGRTDIAWRWPYGGTTEGWYWDQFGWIYLLDGPRLRRVNPSTGADLVVFDISDAHPGCRLWQAHSSIDGLTHGATVERIVSDGKYPALGTVVVRRGERHWFEAEGALDESQVTNDVVVIKETLADGLSNRVIDLARGTSHVIRKGDGAVGHSDCAEGILVGEWSPPRGSSEHGQCVAWDLRTFTRRELFPTWNMGHVSHGGGRWLLSDAERQRLGLVALDGSGVVHLLDHGMTVRDPNRAYDYQVRANLDPTGRVAFWLSNRDRSDDAFDLFLAVLS